jgi:hypothetical protein
VDIDTPNWLLWGRKPTGAVVGYPDGAWQKGIDGVVTARVCVEKNGQLISVDADGPRELGDEVVRVLRTWEWDPVPQPSCFKRRFSFEKDPQPEDFFRTEGEMVVTRAYHPPRPEFVPPLAPIDAEGSVWVRVCPDVTGAPKDVTVLRGMRPDVDDRIAAGISTWKYRPAHLRGQAVAACKIERFVLHPGTRPQPAIPNAPAD